ncbi:MAG: hypothetical protein U0L66_06475 [Acutalibacteraceae bacterium]|nr:hypothetical protein [Acutalibacteraceae bacterium]
MMNFIMSSRIKNEIINAEETRRFLGSLVVSENSCCLCCSNDTGGLLCA